MTAKLMIFGDFWLQDMSSTKPQTFFFVLPSKHFKICQEKQHLEEKKMLLTSNNNLKNKGI